MISLEEANQIFREACKLNEGDWIVHSQNVADLARKIAIKSGLDSEKAYILGLLHDIGRINGTMQARHALEGYRYMLNRCEEVARICLTHTFQYKDVMGIYDTWDCLEEDIQMIKEYLEHITYDDYDKLIQFCDAVSLAKGYCVAEQKMVSSVLKFGFKETTVQKWKAILSLKGYWDNKISGNVYDLMLEANNE